MASCPHQAEAEALTIRLPPRCPWTLLVSRATWVAPMMTCKPRLKPLTASNSRTRSVGPFNSNRTYDGGEMVVHNGLEYISLIRNNTNEPTHSEEQWSAQPRGYIFRGDAPVASTTYQQSHMVRVPAENSWYIATLQGGAQATRAQIPTHTDFQPFVNRLTDANIANDAATVKGVLSGSQLHDFAPALGIAEATSKASDLFGRVSGRRIGEAIDAHVVPSTNATTDVAETSAIGTSAELSRDDHIHQLPTDSTLHWGRI